MHDTALQTTGLAVAPRSDVPALTSAIEPSTTVAGGKLGRFMILEPLGSGAMGVVYTAYDETLDRKVAVKVLRDTGASAQSRLLREAQAMARVSHPNVVTVLEAGVAGGQVYVAMEFIRGMTLAAWLKAQPRSWQEIVEVFAQAGRGLAAAHAAGLVHRDFKPSNVMVDEAGRARVLDFGLVRAATPELPRAKNSVTGSINSSSKLDMQLTHDDQIVGTPAYMAPEHWRGLSPEPAADQFSFCVALYEALYDAPPFRYVDVAELVHKVLKGQADEPPRKRGLPAWLAQVVMRGLKAAPKDRYPGMPALLAALDRGRARGRRRWVVAAALAATAVATGSLLARSNSEGRTCTGAPEELARVWGQARRDAVATALGAAAPGYASVVWPRVQEELDRYAADWRATHRDACVAHRRGQRSGALLDHQMRCLDQRLRALDETVTTLAAADADVALRALDVAGDLPPLAGCRNLEALASELPPPDDPDSAAKIAELRGQMTQAQVLARSGRQQDALALATEVVAASESVDYPPVRAEALLLRSKLDLHLTEQTDEKIARLTRAIGLGFQARVDGIAAEAMALRIYALARQADEPERALADEPLALALAERSATPEALRGLVLNNIGTAYLAKQDPAQARRYFTEALAVREAALGSEDREVAYTLVNLALASEPGREQQRLLERALAIFELALGPAHPETIEVRLTAAHLVDPGAGPGLVRPGCAALDRFLTGDVVRRSRCLLYLGRLALELGDDDEADFAFVAGAQLGERAVASAGAGLTDFEYAALVGYAALSTGAHEAAIRRIEAALVKLPQAWWSRGDAAELRLLLGHNLLASGQAARARDSFTASIGDYVAVIEAEPHLKPALARARRGLAEALVALSLGGDADTRTNLAASLEFYRDAGPSFARQLARTERLMAETGVEPEARP
ncbi:serine/threonine-protein kinase [Nannocystis pusilla]|uniref:Serine/threonine-protein kinase n=1 Tax=Nannocystis pusilla TaxID=889268 RepID=A0ABS7TND6_9BACT|nr:serine/threonine-protein kinase [Nannocystis pusilla]MBZ5709739.1 serine/threonine-protein kinase [Nannocystis pusilla]